MVAADPFLWCCTCCWDEPLDTDGCEDAGCACEASRLAYVACIRGAVGGLEAAGASVGTGAGGPVAAAVGRALAFGPGRARAWGRNEELLLAFAAAASLSSSPGSKFIGAAALLHYWQTGPG